MKKYFECFFEKICILFDYRIFRDIFTVQNNKYKNEKRIHSEKSLTHWINRKHEYTQLIKNFIILHLQIFILKIIPGILFIPCANTKFSDRAQE